MSLLLEDECLVLVGFNEECDLDGSPKGGVVESGANRVTPNGDNRITPDADNRVIP